MLAYASRQNIKYIYLEETGSINTSDCGGHLWPGHQILRDKLSLKGENVPSSRSGSNTARSAHRIFSWTIASNQTYAVVSGIF